MTPLQRAWRWMAVACAGLAIAPGYYAARLRWSPPADFDVVGILSLFQNLPRLTAIVLTGVSLGGATDFWVHSLRG